ncbi:hypothetical protein NRK67_01670 [Fusobacteria bacterium ZRK30]|nr:hypothetical protein NRK67_01670 [Fusobacteria bacterium ZRK30]
MDTIDIRLILGRPLDEQKIKYIKENIKWISKLGYKENKCSFVISFPKFFYPINNAYLVETQREVDMVLHDVIRIFENYHIQEAYTKRIDYPFTFNMPEGRTFNSYFELFRLVGIIKKANPAGNSKYYGSIVRDEKETVIFTNTTNTNNFSKRVMIYNQAIKIKESKASSYEDTINKFPNLERRMRIEIAFKEEVNILDGKSLRLDLGKIKRKYASYLANGIFNKRSIDEGIKIQIENLNRCLEEKYPGNIKWKNLMMNKIIDPGQVISSDIFNAAIKKTNLSERGKQSSRKALRDTASETEMVYENIGKDLNEIMMAILEQSRKI